MDENKLPDSEFKNQLSEFGFIKKGKIENITIKILYKEFKKYEKEIKNIIVAEFDDINNDIRIINSFENYKREKNTYGEEEYDEYKINDSKYKNEEEIMKNLKIKINEKKIDFLYFYKFEKEGKYKIEYSFKNNLTKIININLSNFCIQNVTNMSGLFAGREFLANINLFNFYTQNVTNMSGLFAGCKSLKSIDLSNFDTQNVTNRFCMFVGCKSLTNINLSNFNTRITNDMYGMFSDCNSLINLNFSYYDSQSVTNMRDMFSGCTSLITLDLSNFNTQKVTNMSRMFYEYSSLININLSNFNAKKVTVIYDMFTGCKTLKEKNIIFKDNKIIKEFRNSSELK